MENEEEICRKFLQNPGINPRTGGRLNYKMGPYNEYVELCKKYGLPTPRISSTRSVTLPQISKSVLPSKTIQSSNKIGLSGLHELDQEIILNSDLESIINLYSTNKLFRKLIEQLLPQIIQKHQETIVNLDLNSILNLYPTNELSKQIIEQLLPQIAQKYKKFDKDYQGYKLDDEVANFALQLLKYNHLKLLKQLLEIFVVTNIYFKYNYEYSLYIRLGYDLFERERESNFVNQTMIENYFKLISTDMNLK